MRLPAYDFREEELTDAIDDLLADQALRTRLAAVSTRLKANPGNVRAANLIEQVARTGEPVAGAVGRQSAATGSSTTIGMTRSVFFGYSPIPVWRATCWSQRR